MDVLHSVTFFFVSIYFVISIYRNPAAPTAYIIYFFSLYYFASVLGERVLIYDFEFELYWYAYYIVVVFALLTGKWLAKYLKLGITIQIPNKVIKHGMIFYFIMMVPFWLFFIIGIAGYLLSGKGSYGDSWSFVRNIVVFGNPLLTLGLFVVLAYYMTKKIIFVFILLPILLIAFVLGERGDIANIILALLPVALINIRKKAIYPVLFLIMISFAGLYGNARAQLEVGVIHFVQTIFERMVESPILLVAPVDVNEFVNVIAPSKAAMQDDLQLPDKGMNIARGVVKVVPFLGRTINGEYGTSGEIVRDTYFKQLYDQDIVSGSGALLPLGIDLYLAGGLSLTFLGLFLFSFYINRLYNVFSKNDNVFLSLVYILSFPLFVIQVQRSGFESAFVYLFKHYYLILYFILLFYFIYLVLLKDKKSV